jgi:ABC-type branched-subunit amino acid transport system permease subunit
VPETNAKSGFDGRNYQINQESVHLVKIFEKLILGVVTILSIAAGAAKVMQAPQEMEFLQGVGLSPAMIFIFGLAQVAAGVLVAIPKTRLSGAILAMATFTVSAILIFISGNETFGLISAIPVALAAFIAYKTTKPSHSDEKPPG